MSLAELESEIAKGVRFYGYRIRRRLVGVMGVQDVKDVTLIRHAYVHPKYQKAGYWPRTAPTHHPTFDPTKINRHLESGNLGNSFLRKERFHGGARGRENPFA